MDDTILAPLGEISRGTWADAYAFAFRNSSADSRYVSLASFAIQAKLLGADPAISRLLNILLHVLNAVLVCYLAMAVARISGKAQGRNFAACCAIVWMVLPVHATTVLYPIQRMTMLGATGSLVVLTLLLGPLSTKRVLLVAVAYALATFSKESSILALPVGLLARVMLSAGPQRQERWYLGLAAVSAAFIAMLVAFNVELEIPLRYSAWDFGLLERLLLAPRIFLEHAQTVLFPAPRGFSFYYDDYALDILRPLPRPYLVSLIVSPLVFLALARLARYNAVAAIGALYFILLHTVEGTALALDLYFEHRNYLPSVGLALAVVAIHQHLSTRLHIRRPILGCLCVAYLIAVCVFRSHIIGDEVSLTKHHIATHPRSFRTIHDAAYFDVAVERGTLQSYPYPIELLALELRLSCQAMPPRRLVTASASSSAVPKRSLRLHEDTMRLCANQCLLPQEYLLRVANAYLTEGRRDSYHERMQTQLSATFEARHRLGCAGP